MPPPGPAALLPEMVLLVRVMVPLLRILWNEPPLIGTPLIVTVAAILKMREGLGPRMANRLVPGSIKFRPLVMSNSSLNRAMVCLLRLASKRIVSP